MILISFSAGEEGTGNTVQTALNFTISLCILIH